jgi:hypothetical protein
VPSRRLQERLVIEGLRALLAHLLAELSTGDQPKADLPEPLAIHRNEPEPTLRELLKSIEQEIETRLRR